ncbi:MAG: hypothetical protein R2831_00505 [Chitinophagaceae bacterium]
MKKYIFVFLLIAYSQLSIAQSSFMKRNMDDQFVIDQVDILQHRLSDSFYTTVQPYSQKDAIILLENYVRSNPSLSLREREEIYRIIAKNSEWATLKNIGDNSKYPFWSRFYKKKSDFVHLKLDNATLVLNPILNYQQMIEKNNTGQNLFLNSKGLELRATLADRIGIYSSFTDNQERGPWHHQQYVLEHDAIPGANFYKKFKEDKPGLANDYLVATGYLDAEVIKKMVNVSFGHNRFHIGDGYRSLFLSDVGSNYLFLRINTKIGKLNYQNLFMELTPSYARKADRLLPKKYAAMHHLSINATKWLNVGIFEGIVYGRKDHFEFQYLNPIILYRSVEQGLGSPDNAVLGLNFKINTKINTVLYGQMLLDEFKFSELKAGNGWWANKYAIQLGAKVARPFGIKNLLLQGELNMIRPFTYTRDSVSDYSHYNQPLAHPFGANFLELNFIAQYKPVKNVQLTWRSFFNKQGRDSSANLSYGSDITKPYTWRNDDYGVNLFNGFPSEVLFTNLNFAYELRYNLFIDLGFNYRYQNSTSKIVPAFQSLQVYSGFRLNAVRRTYDY